MRILLINHQRRFKASWRSVKLAAELARRGHQPTVLCIADTARFASKTVMQDGVEIVESPDLLPGRLRSGWDLWDCLWRARFLKRREFDLIHAFESRPATIHPVLGALRRRSVPLVMDWIDWWGRGGLITEQRPWWYRKMFGGIETWYEEHFRTRADATTVISHGLLDRAVKLGVPAESIFWIPNGCSPQDAAPDVAACRAKFQLPPDAFVVGFSALDVTLGLELILRALRLLAQSHPNALLMMTGKLTPEMTRQFAEMGIADRVRHLGFVSDADFPRALACADVFAVPFIDKPANWGRWPGRVNEYFVLGKPIVTNPVGEMKTLLTQHEVGLLAAERPEDFAEKLGRLAADAPLRARFGENARHLAATGLQWKAIVDRLEDAYGFAIRAHSANRGGPPPSPRPS